jgi:hypothetical protein
MAIDSNGTKWFGSNIGVANFDNYKWKSFENQNDTLLPDTVINSIAADHHNNIWIASNGKGLYKYDGTSWSVFRSYNSNIRHNFLTGTAVDTSNQLWVGTSSNGISVLDSNNWSSHTKASGMAENVVNCITVNEQNHKWIGLENKGVNVYDGSSWINYNTANSLMGSNKVLSIAFDTSGASWIISNQSGVTSFDGSNWQQYTMTHGLVSNNTSSVAVDKYNNKWVGTASGVSMFDGLQWTSYTTSDGLFDDNVYYVKTDQEGYIWFCTKTGISRYHPYLPGEGIVTGITKTCRNTTNTYTVTAIKGAASYEWILPSGATGSSTTNTINVDFGPNAFSGMVSVRAKNAHGAGNICSRYVLVERNKPLQAGPITGKTSVKKNSGLVGYSVNFIKDATSYIWTLPPGVTGSSTTNSIMLTFTSGAISGYITVKGHNECGDGAESKLYVTVTGIMENDLSDKIEVYPNPFEDHIDIKMDASLISLAKLRLYDISGKCMLEKQLNDAENIISTQDLSSGTYLLKIFTDEGVLTKLMIK